MKILIALLLMISTSVFAADWHKYTVESDYMQQASLAISGCMAQKSLDVKQGTEYDFAERFYKQCVIKHNNSSQQYSRKFKRITIDRYHYILQRLKELDYSMKA